MCIEDVASKFMFVVKWVKVLTMKVGTVNIIRLDIMVSNCFPVDFVVLSSFSILYHLIMKIVIEV